MKRLPRRLLQHHLPLGLATFSSGFILFQTRPYPDVVTRLSFASAYPALILASLTLLIGPLKQLKRNRVPVSIDLRRDVGIWAGITGIFHAAIGQCVHLRWRPWLYYVYEDWRVEHLVPLRHDLFGLANYSGLAAAIILLALLATSNDASLRKLRTPGWKNLQRWNYACFALTALHTFVYQEGVEAQKAPFLLTSLLAVGFTSFVQWRGFQLRRRVVQLGRSCSTPTSPVGQRLRTRASRRNVDDSLVCFDAPPKESGPSVNGQHASRDWRTR